MTDVNPFTREIYCQECNSSFFDDYEAILHQFSTDWTGALVTSMHLRAARALLGWTAQELSERGNVHLSTVQRMERCQGPVRGNVTSLNAVVEAFQDMGIEFVSEKGRVGVILNDGDSAKGRTA